MPILNELLGV